MPPSPPPVNPLKKITTTSKRARGISVVAMTLAIITGILSWLAWKEVKQITQIVKIYASQVSQQTQTTIKTQHTTMIKFKNQLDTLQTKFNEMQTSLNQFANVQEKIRKQRAFSEASYLIQLANLQLSINHNIDTALTLMKSAHEQLKTIPNAHLNELKQSVTKDITILENAPKVNVAELLKQLNQLKLDVFNLPEMPTQISTTTTQTMNTNQKKETKLAWYKKIEKNFSGLKKLIIIRHNKKPIKPLLTSQQLLFLKQNVQLKISEAEWAVLYQKAEVYQQSLQSAKQMLEMYYPNDAIMESILQQIQALLKININPPLPNLSNTLNKLKEAAPTFSQSFQAPTPPATTTANTDSRSKQ